MPSFNPLHCHTQYSLLDGAAPIKEMIQKAGPPPPAYRITSETGPDHDKTFRVALESADYATEGTGKSKKAAEQDAARRAYEYLNGKSGK